MAFCPKIIIGGSAAYAGRAGLRVIAGVSRLATDRPAYPRS
ncbi:hypothetical protein JOF56_003566 [Kibdelosporangium banguiense]|uniref:Uncharacterized protein n=1 Tax=Kibdelosporangium banguiense TaxID=1365924 RepID=A0ABS4TFR5_9PSEU|nr:hypothetical protein [Kibdelosporangium banguiense]